jgi:hypothetical protein
MRRRSRFFTTTLVLLALVATGLMTLPLFRPSSAQQSGAQPGGEAQLSASAQAQIRALLDEKASRTPAQRKIESPLLYAIKERRGEPLTSEIRSLRSSAAIAKTDEKGWVEVDITGNVSKELIAIIRNFGGEPTYVSERAGAVRARVPLEAVEILATMPDVRTIRKAAEAVTNRRLTGASGISLSPAVAPPAPVPVTNVGSVTSQGDTAHRAAEARNFFGVNGEGVKIGVLSNMVDFDILERSIASGDLPPDVTVLPGESSIRGGEGTALLEIIHDLAPGAKLFLASYISIPTVNDDEIADQIRALRAAGCDIIVYGDSSLYLSSQSPFHDNAVNAAVEEVVADGALYFSPTGDYNNFNKGSSTFWEGDFKNSGITLPSLPGATLNDFGNGVIANRITNIILYDPGFIYALWLRWSDPRDASNNDYDLFIMDDTLTTLIDASTNIQDGDDDPIEQTYINRLPGERVLILKAYGAEDRALHMGSFAGKLEISTPGSAQRLYSGAGAFSVAAIDVNLAGGRAFTGGPTNTIEEFSSDGPRRVFYKSDGTPYTPGNLLFSTNGGVVRQNPDLTAANRVATSVPLYTLFHGTHAATAHAAAIAALLKTARPTATPDMIRQALTETALDIEAIGVDRDSGAGIVDAFAALQFLIQQQP